MPPRKTPRLAYCEYVIPDPKDSTAVLMARLDLMRAVRRVYPTMLQRLSSDVFPAYKALAETGFDLDAILWSSHSPFTALGTVDARIVEFRLRNRAAEPGPIAADGVHNADSDAASSEPMPSDDQILQAAEDGDFSTFARLRNEKEAEAYRRRKRPPESTPAEVLRKCAALRDALKDWGIKFNAHVLWFLDETLRTLGGWYVAPDWRDSLMWNPIHSVTTLAVGERFEFEFPRWEMQLLTWAKYRKSLETEFKRKLEAYEKESRRFAESRGLVRAPHKYSPSNFDWFVLYQFAGLSSPQIVNWIGQDPNVDESTVLKGVKAAAKLAGWDCLRPAPRRNNRKIR